MEKSFEEIRFNKIFGFVVFFGLLTIILISCIVFLPIPEKNQQSANMALAFCMSAFTGLSGYLIGASPEKKKEPANTQQDSITVTKSSTDNTAQP